MRKQHWQDWVNIVLGLSICVSPRVLSHAMVASAGAGTVTELAMFNHWIVGLGVMQFAGCAIVMAYAWAEWVNLALGAWLFVSPWALGFGTSVILTSNACIVGALVMVLAGRALRIEQPVRQPIQWPGRNATTGRTRPAHVPTRRVRPRPRDSLWRWAEGP